MENQITFIPKADDPKIRYSLDPKWRPFQQAREYARSLNLQSREEWETFSKSDERPGDIPFAPSQFYKYQGWTGYVDWLGLLRKNKSKFQRFKYARNFVRSLRIDNRIQWNMYCTGKLQEKGIKPVNIPSSPDTVYAEKGWVSWNDWFGCGIVECNGKVYEPFVDAKIFARSLKLKDVYEWFSYCNGEITQKQPLPETIPSSPHEIYKKCGWVSWRDWLGVTLTNNYRTFEEAKKFAIALKLKSGTEWRKYCSGVIINKVPFPEDIPVNPHYFYKNEWTTWGDFLGTGFVAASRRKFVSFEKAKEFALKLNLKSSSEWYKYCKPTLL